MSDGFRSRVRRAVTRDRFVGETGLVFESLHLPRIAGQIFGALLLAPTEGYTATQLGDMLQASKGSISGMTRLLIHYGLVTRTSLPGDRRDRFIIKPGASAEMLLGRMALLGQLQELAVEGLDLLGPDGDPGPLTEVRDMYAFLQRELPRLLERWERERPSRSENGEYPAALSEHDGAPNRHAHRVREPGSHEATREEARE